VEGGGGQKLRVAIVAKLASALGVPMEELRRENGGTGTEMAEDLPADID
jgi:hypothetical protein